MALKFLIDCISNNHSFSDYRRVHVETDENALANVLANDGSLEKLTFRVPEIIYFSSKKWCLFHARFAVT